jgi:hypothetical protein
MKPIMEARAKAQQVRKPDDFVSPKSDEQQPIRTDAAVASFANLGKAVFCFRRILRKPHTSAKNTKTTEHKGRVAMFFDGFFVGLKSKIAVSC